MHKLDYAIEKLTESEAIKILFKRYINFGDRLLIFTLSLFRAYPGFFKPKAHQSQRFKKFNVSSNSENDDSIFNETEVELRFNEEFENVRNNPETYIEGVKNLLYNTVTTAWFNPVKYSVTKVSEVEVKKSHKEK
ncbi:hypothetical protein HK099_000757 [Clydaea vesicula]|uniref:Uncharacterized protein n=1 Tax=Clydaea vesicula TaxID=447962 RepID=A0AAD5XSP6_9FUNG|nr:hypothetical protein HK099_000757 [Clydaea vesicula]KAJ3387350.1 hypothetical protein HDU92_001984 [Lobulomyces angularis]